MSDTWTGYSVVYEDWVRPNGGYRCDNCSSTCVEAEAYCDGYDAHLKLECQQCDAGVWQ